MTPRTHSPGSTHRRWRLAREEEGTALTEAAILFPVLILLLWWSSAMTDVMVLKLKASEAVRFALWENTVFRSPQDIRTDVQARFRDLRSPASINNSYTGLMMYPQANNVVWTTEVDPRAQRIGIGGRAPNLPGDSWLRRFLNQVSAWLSKVVDTAVQNQKFNVYGYAEARVALTRASHIGSQIMNGGDLVGAYGRGQLDHPNNLRNFTFLAPLASEHPMRLVFDTWKAWPKPASYTLNGAPTNVGAAPSQTYPVVEEQVAAQVKQISFFGLNRLSWFNSMNTQLSKLTNSGFMKTIMGGRLPNLFSTERMDGPLNGPVTILPVERPDVSWAPGAGLKTSRMGDEGNSGTSPTVADNAHSMGPVDRSRYTVPYRINSVYWSDEGGTRRKQGAFDNRTTRPKAAIVSQNEYVKSFACRGHYFSGSTRAQETDRTKRYKPSCANR